MPALNPWQRRLFTVWNLPSDPQDVVRACRAWGCDGVEIKVGDGNSPWVNRRNVTRGYVDALRAGGLSVLGWTYNYCDGKRNAGDRGDGIPEEEADVARDSVLHLGLDGHTFDLEIECEGHGDLVAVMLDRFRRLIPGYAIAAHTWADLRGHEAYPIHEISVLVDVVRPMIYRPVWNAAGCHASLGERVNGKPIVPVWGITEATPAGLAADRAFAADVGWKGEALWEFTARGNDALRAVVVGGAPEPVPGPNPEPDRVAAALARLRAATDELEQAIKEAA